MERPTEERRASAQTREVHRGRRFVVTRTVGPNRRSLIEKTVEPGQQDPSSVAALLHEAAVLRRLEAPGVEKIVALRTVRSVPVLVLEDAGPVALRDRTRRPFEVDAFLDLAVRLAEILAHVHACDVIHRDINPSNVVLDASDAPTLIDFDRAATGSSIATDPHDELSGPLVYASPEQLGRTNRLVDARSDLYSLGTVFYEMLTGAPPFRSDDPLEVIHAHLAKLPVSPTVIAAGVPWLLSGIVLKLLSKMPEARYQTAAALAADLSEARQRWQRGRSIEPFELGSLDLALELPMPERLYGREEELATLRAAVARAGEGTRELILVGGDAGVGKSALVMAIREEVTSPSGGQTEPRCRFISGKFDLRAANAPFASLIEALRDLVRELGEESEEKREDYRTRILRAVGDNGRVLTELLPELGDLVGALPPLTALEPREAQTRLHVVLSAFLQVFASPGRPIVIFLDDLHWADAASLDAMHALAADPEANHMLLLGAFRSREVGPGHPLTRFEAALRRERMPASRLDLAPLTERAVQDFLGDTLRAAPARVGPLAELLARKTAGNPFFLRQILGTLHKTGLLTFDLRDHKWSWGIAQIERVGITENVVELLLEAIRRLPEETRALLPLAACIGKLAGPSLLAEVSGASEAEVRAGLEPAFREGLLVVGAAPGKFQFAHDRVQQAAYSLLTEPTRKRLHVSIGRILEARTVVRGEDATFEATDQQNLGADILVEPAERLELASLNHRAGLKAKSSTAFGPALAYMRSGLSMLPPDAWDMQPDLTFLLHREAAECAYLAGDYALSDDLVELALVHSASLAQRLDLHNLRIVSAAARAAWQEALDHGRGALAELGYTLPSYDVDMEPAIAEEQRAFDALRAGRPPAVLLNLPLMTDSTDLAVLRLLVNLAHPAWWFRDRGLFRLLTFRALRFILERGHGPESMTALCDMAMCLSSQDQFEEADAYGSIAQDLAWRLGHPGQQAHAQFLYAAFVLRWRQPYSVVIARVRRSLESAKKVGEMRSAAYALSACVIFGFAEGRELDDLLRQVQEDMPFMRKTRNDGTLAFHLCYRQSIRCLKGLTAGRNRFAEPGFDEEAFLRAAEGVPSLICLYWIRRLHTSFIFRDVVVAHGYAEAARQLMATMAGYVPAHDYLPFSSLCLAALCESGPVGKRAEWLAQIADNQRRLARWAESCPANFRHLYVLVEAEVARIDQRLAEASDLYDEAIEAASEGGFVHDAAVATELAGRHALSRGRIRIADLYLRKARERYARWGAAEKVRALEEEFPEMGRSEATPGGRLRDSELDILSLLKSAETISTEVVLDRLLERLVDVCAEAAGADRVVVVLEEDGEPFVRATGTTTGRVGLERTALTETTPLSRHAIEQARVALRPLVVEEAVHDPRVAADPYVVSRAMKSILAVPVQRRGKLVAILYFENNLVTHAFTRPRLRVLELLSAQIASALENSLLFEKLKREVADRRRAEHTVRFLANAGAELAESLDADQIFDKLTRLLVPELADWCAIDVLDDSRQIHRVAARHVDPAKEALVREFQQNQGPDWSSPQPPAVVLRTGASLLIENATDDVVRSSTRNAEHLRLVRALGVRSVVSVPMITRGRTVGVITCCISDQTRCYGPADVTVAKEMAQRAALAIDNARLVQKAQDAVRVREEFLSVAAHELHTPITSLHLMMQALQRGGVPVTPETVRQTFSVADRQVRRLIKLIDELLDVSRIEAHRFPIERERIDLGALVREIAERFTDDAVRAGSTVSVDMNEAVVGHWDPMRLEQVVSNLLSNALKFGGGHPIELSVTCTASPQADARLAVRDHGIGVDPDRLAHIFERFERGVSTRQYGGLGLGLYIVRSIVDGMGGLVRCEATPGGGATFVVTLPCSGTGRGVGAPSGGAERRAPTDKDEV
ncbi:MAG TPA: ATP-binding sensor histidine kinase [Polyangiaceae bacterium]|nr:ATP-binding sensor histidine kinase [Polyangiaceae bacterium]